MVEARGIEPLSENIFISLSTGVVCFKILPQRSKQTKAERASLLIHEHYKDKLMLHVHH